MMKNFLLVICYSFFALKTWGQLTPTVTPVIDQFGIMKSMSPKPVGQKGSVYLNDEWLTSDVYLKQGAFSTDKIEDVPIKLDLQTNTIEINTEDGIKVLWHSKVEKFEWFNPRSNTREVYTNCNNFALNGSKFNGFCTIYGEDVRLVKHNYLELQKADYNVTLDVGNKEDRIIKKSKLYLLKGKELIECSKKTVYAVMADKSDQIKQYVKKNRLAFDEESDLRSVIDYYNSI